MSSSLLILIVGVACFVSLSDGANILMLPFLNASHFLEMDGVGRPLAARGHNLYVLLDEDTALPKGAPYKLVTHRYASKSMSLFRDKKYLFDTIEKSQSGFNFTLFFDTMKSTCTDMLSDKDMLPTLRALKLDLVILDPGALNCFFIIPHTLGIPFVTVTTLLLSWSLRLPILPSVVKPVAGLELFGLHFCEETPSQLSIVRRLCRTVALLAPDLLMSYNEEDYMRQYVDFPSITAIRENVSLALINSNYLLSSPLPKLPHVEYVGGLTTRPAKPLEDSLEKWMSAAPNVVVASFGSMFPSLPPALARKLFDAFRRMSKYRFLFRFSKQDSKAYDVPENVRVMDWLPQNDALGHKSTRAFITHSGNNGQQEALYHGVPMLCFYIHNDQKANAKRVVDRGYGKMLSVHDFTVDSLVNHLTDLLDNHTYSARIKKAAAIFHSEKHPSERAADAVEHVLKYGAEHLRPKQAYQLTVWQFYMLDVLAVIYVAALLVLVVSYKVGKCVLCKVLRRVLPQHCARAHKTESGSESGSGNSKTKTD